MVQFFTKKSLPKELWVVIVFNRKYFAILWSLVSLFLLLSQCDDDSDDRLPQGSLMTSFCVFYDVHTTHPHNSPHMHRNQKAKFPTGPIICRILPPTKVRARRMMMEKEAFVEGSNTAASRNFFFALLHSATGRFICGYLLSYNYCLAIYISHGEIRQK